MFKQFAKFLFILALLLSLLLGQVSNIQAQGLTPTPTPTPAVGSLPLPADPNMVTFDMLGRAEIQLIGPYDSGGFTFSVPANWELQPGTQLDLDLGIIFNSAMVNSATPATSPAVFRGTGTLTVRLDDVVIGIVPLNTLGETKHSFLVPVDIFTTNNTDQQTTVNFTLNSDFACNTDQNTSVFIHPTSSFTLPHQVIKPDTSLINFPRPIYQNSIIKNSALLVVADKPSAADMAAAYTVAAGLSNLTFNSVLMDLTTVSKLTPEQQKANHIIFVGGAGSLSSLAQLSLPLPLTNKKFEVAGGKPDDGIIQMINSPWSDEYVVLVVSGNTDAGIAKAAQAISTGVIQPGQLSNLAVIDTVELQASSAPQAEFRTLAEMGYGNNVVQSRGVNFVQYTFTIPAGYTVTSDAYFDLIYGHSALLDFNRSAIVIQLNNRPIGSVKMTEASAGISMNTIRIKIPAAAVIPGENVLQIVANLIPIDDCTPPNLNEGLWVNFWAESLFRLPLVQVSIDPTFILKDLATYLPSLTYNPSLDDTAFVVAADDLESWRSALQFAVFLGDQASGPITALSAFYADAVPAEARSKYNFLMFGVPTQMPVVGEINSSLPAPFVEKSNVPITSNFRVTYRVPPEVPLGFVEFFASPWNPNKVILAVLGNSTLGTTWATNSLVDQTISWRMAGNFAIVNNRQILTTDTTMAVSSGVAEQGQGQAAQPEVSATTVAQVAAVAGNANWTTRTDWILPALVVLGALILLIMAIVIIGSWSRNRTRQKRG